MEWWEHLGEAVAAGLNARHRANQQAGAEREERRAQRERTERQPSSLPRQKHGGGGGAFDSCCNFQKRKLP